MLKDLFYRASDSSFGFTWESNTFPNGTLYASRFLFIVVSPTQENTQGTVLLREGSFFKTEKSPGMVVHTYVPSTGKAKARKSQILSTLGYRMILCGMDISLSSYAFWVLMRGCRCMVISSLGLRLDGWIGFVTVSQWLSLRVLLEVGLSST